MLETGNILQERYRIERQIGQGGMGSVYRATDERFNNIVAIKETLFADENFRRAFKREARLLNSLKHTALPKVSDHFIEGNGQYIVMEYIAGEDLFEMIERSGRAFPFEDVLIWAEQLLDALEYLHGQEDPIIHRDIKPQNLKLTPHGQVILLDFGLAKGNPTNANHQTAANSIFGYSRNYASLEQIQGTGTDPRSDLYSLAATLYHLVTGKPPADALTRVMLVLNDGEDPLQPAHLVHEQVTEQFSEVLARAMSLKAADRPQTAAEMRSMLFEEERTSVSTRPQTAPFAAAGAADLSTQNTKIMEDGGDAAGTDRKQSDIDTELLPFEPAGSVATKMARPRTRTAGADTNDPVPLTAPRSYRSGILPAVASAVALCLLVVAAAAAWLWSTDPGMTRFDIADPTDSTSGSGTSGVVTETSADLPAEGSAEPFSDPAEPAVEEISAAPGGPPAPAAPDEPKAAPEPLRPVPPKRTDGTGSGRTSASTGDVRLSDGRIEADGVIVSGDRIETDEAVIEGRNVFLKNGQKITVTPEQMELMTPEQRKKVREAIEAQRRLERQKKMRNKRYPPPPPDGPRQP